ncbi:MAG: hypothetical protein Q7T01_00835 [bacterium]|nr:hypothetical protein [bacterium]
MLAQRTLRNWTLAATVVSFVVVAFVIVSDIVRPLPPPQRVGAAVTRGESIDVDAVEALLRDPRFRTLVLLAPNVTPGRLGNPNPFAVFEGSR